MSLSEPRLTIAIPTFDRNETLRRTLPALVPQLTVDCRLLIIDNCSATPVEETVADLLTDVPTERYSIVRNRFNIGANANIMRCFELCETEWLWVLGDDDLVRPDAVATVLRQTAEHPQCVFFLFSVDGFYEVPEPRQVFGLHELVGQHLQTLIDFEVLGFTSTTIYCAPSVQPLLRFGHQFTYTNLAHVALLFRALGDDAECRFVTTPLLRDIVLAANAGTYDYTELLLGRTIILDLPMPDAVRSRLLELFHSAHWTPKQLALDLLGRIRQGQSQADMLYRYDQVFARLSFQRRSLSLFWRTKLYRNLLRFPRVSYWLMANAYYPHIRRRPMPSLSSSNQSEPFERI